MNKKIKIKFRSRILFGIYILTKQNIKPIFILKKK